MALPSNEMKESAFLKFLNKMDTDRFMTTMRGEEDIEAKRQGKLNTAIQWKKMEAGRKLTELDVKTTILKAWSKIQQDLTVSINSINQEIESLKFPGLGCRDCYQTTLSFLRKHHRQSPRKNMMDVNKDDDELLINPSLLCYSQKLVDDQSLNRKKDLVVSHLKLKHLIGKVEEAKTQLILSKSKNNKFLRAHFSLLEFLLRPIDEREVIIEEFQGKEEVSLLMVEAAAEESIYFEANEMSISQDLNGNEVFEEEMDSVRGCEEQELRTLLFDMKKALKKKVMSRLQGVLRQLRKENMELDVKLEINNTVEGKEDEEYNSIDEIFEQLNEKRGLLNEAVSQAKDLSECIVKDREKIKSIQEKRKSAKVSISSIDCSLYSIMPKLLPSFKTYDVLHSLYIAAEGTEKNWIWEYHSTFIEIKKSFSLHPKTKLFEFLDDLMNLIYSQKQFDSYNRKFLSRLEESKVDLKNAQSYLQRSNASNGAELQYFSIVLVPGIEKCLLKLEKCDELYRMVEDISSTKNWYNDIVLVSKSLGPKRRQYQK